MSRQRKYWILAERDDATSPFYISFGDYDRECVKDEFQDRRDHYIPKKNLRIVSCVGHQRGCQEAIDALNA